MKWKRLPLVLFIVVGVACGEGTPGRAQEPEPDLAGPARAAKRAYREEIAELRVTIARAPASATAVHRLMTLLETVGEYDEAVRIGREFLTDHPDSGRLWNRYGTVLQQVGRLNDARTAHQRALSARVPDSMPAFLNLGIIAHATGRRDSALSRFRRIVTRYNGGGLTSSADLEAAAAAARYLGDDDPQWFRAALRVYDEAIAADSTNLSARLRLGWLFLDKYNGTDAQATFEEALAKAPGNPDALYGLARAQAFNGEGSGAGGIEAALEVNPNHVPSRLQLARMRLEAEAYDEAAKGAERALETNPASIEALSLLAGARRLGGDESGFEAARTRIERLNPASPEPWETLAELSARNRRYGEAVDYAGRAIERDGRAWHAWSLRGTNRLRVGDIAGGRRDLELAFGADPYDVWTKNTLDLLDLLDRYVVDSSPRFRFVADSAEAPVMATYLSELAERAYDRLAAKYGYRPPVPVRVELFRRTADFSVRTIGLAGFQALGVSFGPVIAINAPAARPAGEFGWATTFWHELAHTFHLGMTGGRVPRWFSEGLAVYEERQAAPGWGDGVDPGFLLAYREGKLLPVSELNRGFTNPSYPGHLQHSYYQASLVFDLIAQDFGEDRIVGLLRAYADGRHTGQAVLDVLGEGLPAFDKRFDAYLRRRFAGPLTALRMHSLQPDSTRAANGRPGRTDFFAQLLQGRRLLEGKRYEDALPFLERARELFPEYAGEDAPEWYLAQAYAGLGRPADAEKALAGIVSRNAQFYDAQLALAAVRMELRDSAGAARALEGAVMIYPLDPGVHERLAVLYRAAGNRAGVVRERRAALALNPADRPEALYQLALAWFEAGNLRAARSTVLQALELAPNFAKAQDLLLSVRERMQTTP